MRRALSLIVAILCAAAANGAPVKISRHSPALQFTYEWPAEAAAIPALDRRFRAEAAAEYRRQLATALKNQEIYRQQQRRTVSDFYLKKWSTAGQTRRLLSLQYQHSAYTGGAHPNTDYGALLWDRRLNRPVALVSLFHHSGQFERLTRPRYCSALDRERRKRRGTDWRLAVGEFNACPRYCELSVAPSDSDHDGRFDTIRFVASPYTAGPYAEGAYDIELPVRPALIERLEAPFRSAFEAQRQ
jgi:hypothetical protein